MYISLKNILPLLLTFHFSLLTFVSYSQSTGVGVNTTGAGADKSAMLDVSATGKGLLIPRMTTANRPVSPGESLLIYNTDTQCFEAYNANTKLWVNSWCLTTCTVPFPPVAGMHAADSSQIVWNWNTVSGATGYKWSTTNNYSSATATTPAGITSYTQSGLSCNTAYTLYVWAYNSCGNSKVDTLIQKTSLCLFGCNPDGTFIDARDGKTYVYVNIGLQTWMGENLNMGTRIDGVIEQTNNGIIEKYCYNDDENNCKIYGGLYQWDEAMQYLTYVTTDTTQGICPAGWHMPGVAEWIALKDYLGGSGIAGGKLKEAGTAHWNSPNKGATNSTCFTALPGGRRVTAGGFANLGESGYWWTWLKQYDSPTYCYLLFDWAFWFQSNNGGTSGFSVRCLRD